MGNIGGGEILVILLAALIFLGPEKLPEVARQIGKVMGEVRKVSAGFQREMQEAMRVPDEPARPAPVIEPPTSPVSAGAPVVSVVEGIDASGPFVETTVDTGDDDDTASAAAVDAFAVDAPPIDAPSVDTAPAAETGADETPTPETTTEAPARPAAVTPSEAPPLPDVAYGGDR